MSITVRDLLKLNIFRDYIELISDESGLDNLVNWPYVKQTVELKQWINGGELVFVIGNNADSTESELIGLINEGSECRVSGFVLLCGQEYIQSVSQSVINEANRLKMPLFTLPYNIKLVDIAKEISSAIINSESRDKLTSDFINDLVNHNFKTEEHIRKQGYECGINIDSTCMAMVTETNFDYENTAYNKIIEYRNVMNHMARRIEQLASGFGVTAVSCVHLERCVTLFFSDSGEFPQELYREMDELLDYNFRYSELLIYVGYGNTYSGVGGCLSSISEGERAAHFVHSSPSGSISCHYKDMGLLCLLTGNNSNESLHEYCESILGAVIESDRVNHTEYMITIKKYLENNNNLVSTANELFIHRNTLINRINHIEELTGRSLKTADTKLEFLCAFKLIEYLSE
jgi:sugar diacid utilization regulator